VNNTLSEQKQYIAGVNLRFASVSESKILGIQEDAVPENTEKGLRNLT